MRKTLLIGTVLLAAGCSAQPPAPAKVSWSYGAGNGDGVTYAGPKPVFSRGNGLGNGDSVTSGTAPTENYGYGAENASGVMVQTTPEQRQQVAAPAASTPAPASRTAPGTHS